MFEFQVHARFSCTSAPVERVRIYFEIRKYNSQEIRSEGNAASVKHLLTVKTNMFNICAIMASFSRKPSAVYYPFGFKLEFIVGTPSIAPH